MIRRPVVVVLERGPASYAGLRVAADVAARLRVPLIAQCLLERAQDVTRAVRRVSLASHRRGIEHRFVRPPERDLLSVVREARESASLLVLGRGPGRGSPELRRRWLLGRVLREPGPPVLVVPPRVRSALGQRVVLVAPSGIDPGLREVYDLVGTVVRRVLVVRPADPGAVLDAPPSLDRCLARALSWDERVQRDGGSLEDVVLEAARTERPTLVAVASKADGGRLAPVFAPGPLDRLAAFSPWPLLVAREPAVAEAARLAA